LISTALLQIPVGVVVARHKAKSPWADFVSTPVSVLAGVPAAAPGTVICASPEVTTYYAGEALIDLHRTEVSGYRDNLTSAAPRLWVVLRPMQGELVLQRVTADPAEGEALSGVGDDLVGTVPMPEPIQQALAQFVAQHPVEQPFFKRQRQRSEHETPRPRGPDEGDPHERS
jgi:hypothetical protein